MELANKAEQILPLFDNMTISKTKQKNKTNNESTCLDIVTGWDQMPGRKFPSWYQNSSLEATSVGGDRVLNVTTES